MKLSWFACARLCLPAFLLLCLNVRAQTDMDGIMMRKKNFCSGFQYSYSSWEKYWEGKLNRINENLGTVSTQMIGYMGNYGITSNFPAHWDPKLRIPRGQVVAAASIVSPKY